MKHPIGISTFLDTQTPQNVYRNSLFLTVYKYMYIQTYKHLQVSQYIKDNVNGSWQLVCWGFLWHLLDTDGLVVSICRELGHTLSQEDYPARAI